MRNRRSRYAADSGKSGGKSLASIPSSIDRSAMIPASIEGNAVDGGFPILITANRESSGAGKLSALFTARSQFTCRRSTLRQRNSSCQWRALSGSSNVRSTSITRPLWLLVLAFSTSSTSISGFPISASRSVRTMAEGVAVPQPLDVPAISRASELPPRLIMRKEMPTSSAILRANLDFPAPGGPTSNIGLNLNHRGPGRKW